MYSNPVRLLTVSGRLVQKQVLVSTRIALRGGKVLYPVSQSRGYFQGHRQKLRVRNNHLVTLNHRKFSKANEETFRKFRSFKNGDQFTKKFGSDILQYTAAVAYTPKDRLKNNIDSDDGGLDSPIYHSTDAFDSPTGEDNYILAYTEIGIIVGVLDGVGGWSEQGFDSSAISREIACKVTEIYLDKPQLAPIEILKRAYDLVKSQGIVKVGSTTICFGIIDFNTNKLQALNLGDSWFGVFRRDPNGKYRCVYQSEEQTYYFNAPYQLSIIPQNFLDQAKKRGSKYLMNEPEEAAPYNFDLKSDDILIFTTDGLIDNVFPEDVELYLNDSIMENDNLTDKLGDINKVLVQQTKVLSLNTKFNSAFSQKLSTVTGQEYIGGKPDDITSVMVHIK